MPELKGTKLLREWVKRNEVDALELAKRLERAAEKHELITAPKRPPVTQVRHWLEAGARPWHQYRVLLKEVTDGYVKPPDWMEAAS